MTATTTNNSIIVKPRWFLTMTTPIANAMPPAFHRPLAGKPRLRDLLSVARLDCSGPCRQYL